MSAEDKLYDAFRMAKLLEKYARKEAFTPDEQADMDRWLALREGNRELFARISNENQLAFDLLELQDADTERELVKIARKLQRVPAKRKRMWYGAAAGLVTFLSVGLSLYWYQTENQEATTQEATEFTKRTQDDALPGGNRATLILSDGRTIDLSETQTGIVVGDDIAYTDGTAVLSGHSNGRASDQVYELTTPRGGTYQVTLPDGTRVWLNAGSTLRYPSRFSDDKRMVELEGEAYFEVQRMKHAVRDDGTDSALPFLVKTKGQTIEVLGTEFNVSAYEGETAIKTTLVEGRVRVIASGAPLSPDVVLDPGQQSALHEGGGLDIRNVNVQMYIAWKEGLFHFQNTPFEDIMQQISRWYDVDIIYTAAIPSDTFTGTMSRNLSLMTVLELLNVSNIPHVQLRLVDNQLIVE